MPCSFRKKPDNKKPCIWYLKDGFCSRDDIFRCIEYIERFEPRISYSELQSFLKCRKKWYIEQVMGVEVIPEMSPAYFKRGRYMHQLLSSAFALDGEVVKSIECGLDPNDNREKYDIVTCECIYQAILELGLNHNQGLIEQTYYIQHDEFPKIKSRLDVVAEDHTWFMEFKYVSKPENYLHPTLLVSQLCTYFLCDDRFKIAYMRPIRVPQLRIGKTESTSDYRDRLLSDIKKRPGFYFLNYNKEDKLWGTLLFKQEFDYDKQLNKYKWAVQDIRRMLKEGSWYRNDTACLIPSQCEYLSICETGGVSDLLYRKKERKVGSSEQKGAEE